MSMVSVILIMIFLLQTADEAFTFLSSPKDVQSEANHLVSSIEETIHWLCPQLK